MGGLSLRSPVAGVPQIRLSRVLISLASDGGTDPAELRRKALAAMVLNPR